MASARIKIFNDSGTLLPRSAIIPTTKAISVAHRNSQPLAPSPPELNIV